MSPTFAVPALWCLLAAFLFGASTPLARTLLDGIGPVTLAGLFYLGAALGTAPWALQPGQPADRRREDWPKLLSAVLFGGVIGPVLVLLGLREAPAASVALWLNLEAPATAILGWAFFKEQVDRRTWIAALLVWVASVVLASPSGFGSLRAAALVAAGCFAWGLDNNLTAIIRGYTPAQTTFVKGLGAGAVNLALGVALEGDPPWGLTLAAALVVSVFSYGASIVLYVAGAQRLGATRAQMLFATAPLFGVGLGWLLLGEPMLLAQVAAGALMVAALVVLFWRRTQAE